MNRLEEGNKRGQTHKNVDHIQKPLCTKKKKQRKKNRKQKEKKEDS